MEKRKLTDPSDEYQAEKAVASLGERAAIGELQSEPFDEGTLLAMEEARRITRDPKAKTYFSLAELKADLEG